MKWVSEVVKKARPAIIKLAISTVLLVVVYSLERPISLLLKPLVGEDLAYILYLLLFTPLIFFTSYQVYRVYSGFSTQLIEGPLAKLRIRAAIPTVLLFNRIFGLVLLLITLLWLLSRKIPFLYGLMEGIVASFSGVFSLLIALILALQVKEIVGNYLAGVMIKASGVITEEEFISMGGEYLKVQKVDLSYTRVVDSLGEETYIPNLKFLLETFRKPFSKKTRRYVDLRFSLPYKHSLDEVERKVGKVVERHNSQTQNRNARIEDFQLPIINLADYSVTYELRVKPSEPVFPENLRNTIRRLILQEFGEDLATPVLLDVQRRSGSV